VRELSYLAGVAAASFALVTMIALVAGAAFRGVVAALDGAPTARPLPLDDPLLSVSSLAGGFIGALIGGSIAAWLGRRAPLLSAVALGVA
jgi:hypothetical protein